MLKKIIFDAEINANNMITIPQASRLKYDLTPGDLLSIEAVLVKKRGDSN